VAFLALLAAAASGLLLGGGEAGAASATASRSATVAIKNFKFRPAAIQVAPGTRVIFANRSKLPHTATRRGSFDTGRIRPGKAVAVRFTAKGTYGYLCSIHPEMTGKIIVR
jgi:plastocyanin